METFPASPIYLMRRVNIFQQKSRSCPIHWFSRTFLNNWFELSSWSHSAVPLLPHHSHIRNVSMFNSPWSQVIMNLIFIMSRNWTENLAGNKRWGGPGPSPTQLWTNLICITLSTAYMVLTHSGGGLNDAPRVAGSLYQISRLEPFKYIKDKNH